MAAGERRDGRDNEVDQPLGEGVAPHGDGNAASVRSEVGHDGILPLRLRNGPTAEGSSDSGSLRPAAAASISTSSRRTLAKAERTLQRGDGTRLALPNGQYAPPWCSEFGEVWPFALSALAAKLYRPCPILGGSDGGGRAAMPRGDWSRREVEAVVDDYLSMLGSELAGTPYSKTAHRRALLPRLDERSEQAVEFKHANISAALLDIGFPYVAGYKPRSNYQALLTEVLAERLSNAALLQEVAAADADNPIVMPEVADILAILTDCPKIELLAPRAAEALPTHLRLPTNYIEREARNRSLGGAGELFVIEFERAGLISMGREILAARIEHTSRVRGDYEGYDILSFDETGAERLIEVKTTKYGSGTPFFVTRKEAAVSEHHATRYHLYRLHTFRSAPKLYTLRGAIASSCHLSAATFLAWPR